MEEIETENNHDVKY